VTGAAGFLGGRVARYLEEASMSYGASKPPSSAASSPTQRMSLRRSTLPVDLKLTAWR